MKVEQYKNMEGVYWFYCPGCKSHHVFATSKAGANSLWQTDGPVWSFNGDLEKPTFNPSLLSRANDVCHLFVENGKIKYLNDCTHELAGQTIEMDDSSGTGYPLKNQKT